MVKWWALPIVFCIGAGVAVFVVLWIGRGAGAKLESDLANLRKTNTDLTEHVTKLEKQLGQGNDLVTRLTGENQRLTASLGRSEQARAELEKRIGAGSGYVSAISSNNSTAIGLIQDVSGDIGRAISQNTGSVQSH